MTTLRDELRYIADSKQNSEVYTIYESMIDLCKKSAKDGKYHVEISGGEEKDLFSKVYQYYNTIEKILKEQNISMILGTYCDCGYNEDCGCINNVITLKW